jgi:hypothetical protein
MFRIFQIKKFSHASMSTDPIFHGSILIYPCYTGLSGFLSPRAEDLDELNFNSVKFTFLNHSEKWRGPGASLEALASVP